MQGFEFRPEDIPDPNVATYSRYGHYFSQPVQEIVIFVKAGTNGADIDDPRAVELPHDATGGKWVMSYAENVLGDYTLLDSGAHPLDLPLVESSSLCSEQEYFSTISKILDPVEEAEKNTRRLSAMVGFKREAKAKILERLGLTQQEIGIMLED